MNDNATPRRDNSLTAIRSRLRATVTLSLPGWALAAGALGLVLVIAIALD